MNSLFPRPKTGGTPMAASCGVTLRCIRACASEVPSKRNHSRPGDKLTVIHPSLTRPGWFYAAALDAPEVCIGIFHIDNFVRV
jgi:hypothetical protein